MQFTHTTGTVDTATLPQASLDALLSRGWSHYIGSEQASKVAPSSKFGKDVAERVAKGELSLADADALKASTLASHVAEAITALTNGTIGVRVPGEPKAPKVSPLAKIIERLTSEGMLKTFRANGIKDAKGKDFARLPKDLTEVTFANGQTRTVGALRERFLAAKARDTKGGQLDITNAERITREAEAEMKRQDKAVQGGDLADLLD